MVIPSLAAKAARAGAVAALVGVTVGWGAASPAVGQNATVARPSGREWASFAYDPALHELVMFGGDNGSVSLGTTWTYRYGVWTRYLPRRSPSPRTGAAMVYDAATGQLVLFGGSRLLGTAGGFYGGTWVWTGRYWRLLHPATSPPARHNADIIYDAATQNVVMFGGYNGHYLGDTWTWDGATWTQQHPAASPSPRDTGSFAFDPATGTAVLYGGYDGSAFTDTWTWNGTWNLQHPATSPANPTYAWMATYDPTTQQVVLFGGSDGETWAWNGLTWTRQFPDTSPPARVNGSMADNTGARRVLLFGGQSDEDGSYLNDLWAWDGATWQRWRP